MAGVKDIYVNQAYIGVTESAMNTLTFSKLETGISIFEKVAWLINRIDYDFDTSATAFPADGDNFVCGICVSDQLTDTSLKNSAILDRMITKRADLGTAASGMFVHRPHKQDFSGLPGGGLLVPPNPIYLFAQGTSLPSPMTVAIRIFYVVIQLKAEEFWELVEQRRMIGA